MSTRYSELQVRQNRGNQFRTLCSRSVRRGPLTAGAYDGVCTVAAYRAAAAAMSGHNGIVIVICWVSRSSVG